MFIQVLLPRKRLDAHVACERPLPGMSPVVPVQVSLGEEPGLAPLTLEPLDSLVALGVQLQLRLLSESFSAQVTEMRALSVPSSRRGGAGEVRVLVSGQYPRLPEGLPASFLRTHVWPLSGVSARVHHQGFLLRESGSAGVAPPRPQSGMRSLMAAQVSSRREPLIALLASEWTFARVLAAVNYNCIRYGRN